MSVPASRASKVERCPECGTATTVPRPDDATKPMTPTRAWRIGGRALVAIGLVVLLFGVLAAGDSSASHSTFYIDSEPVTSWYGAHQGDTRVSGETRLYVTSVTGAVFALIGTVCFCTGLSILHRESLQERQR